MSRRKLIKIHYAKEDKIFHPILTKQEVELIRKKHANSIKILANNFNMSVFGTNLYD